MHRAVLRLLASSFAVACLAAIVAPAASAQTIGVFRWQLQPYCNVVELTVVLQGGVYTLDGFDDQCGAGQRGGVTGTAFPNPDGSIGLGLATALAPGGTPVHTNIRLNLNTLGGPWQDSAGNSGTLVYTPGAGIGGAARPVSSNGVAAGSITTGQLAPAAVGAAQINPGQVQVRVSGLCSESQFVRGINADGSVVCGSNVRTRTFDSGDITWNSTTIFGVAYRTATLNVPEITTAVLNGGSVQVYGAFNFGQLWTAIPLGFTGTSLRTTFYDYGIAAGQIVLRRHHDNGDAPDAPSINFKVVVVVP